MIGRVSYGQVAAWQGRFLKEVRILSRQPLATGLVSSLAGVPATGRLMRRRAKQARSNEGTGEAALEDVEPRKYGSW